MEPDSKLKIQWYDVTRSLRAQGLVGPFRIETKENKMGTTLHPGVIVIHCSYSVATGTRTRTITSGRWGCLRVDNVPLMQLEELAQNFLVLAEARYGQ